MKKLVGLAQILTALAVISWFLPVTLIADEPQSSTAPPSQSTRQYRLSRDVQLDETGHLNGQLVDLAGEGLVEEKVQIFLRDRMIAETVTDKSGQFRLRVERTGAYTMKIGRAGIACRCWGHEIAPPSATEQLILLSPESTVRGQRPFADIVTNPLFVGAVIAAAVAIPIAVSSSDGS